MVSRSTIQSRASRCAFTLIELLVVIGIIAVLVALAVVVGAKVVEGGKARATTDVIRVLDTTLGAWQLNANVPLPEFLEVKDNTGKSHFFEVIDAREQRIKDYTDAPNPSARYYSALVMQDESIAAEFRQLDSTFVSSAFVAKPGAYETDERESWALPAVNVRDAWGRPIRFVHPAFHGGHGEYWDPNLSDLVPRDTLRVMRPTDNPDRPLPIEYRRSYRPFKADDTSRKATWIGDADEGMAVGGRAYFYSAGEDGDPGTRANNVYSTEPRFPVETRDFD
ncbi:MAG: prepilin-type N-terminal cleavage/methylation domain-containing protein [Planctomycetota bacterium]|nr:prepilin-type N-terminal cleavage/methylation domain-containing protein [Planctomycetota bacterium]